MTAITGFERDNVVLFIRKDPQSVMDYIVDYTNFLGTCDAISTQAVTVDTGITKDSSAIVSGNKKVTMTLSGGTAGTAYTIKTTVTTSDGLTFVHRYRIKCEEIHL